MLLRSLLALVLMLVTQAEAANYVAFTRSSAITPSVAKSRAADGSTDVCVAPCAVVFDATASTSTATALPFHEIEVLWNFGDDDAALWSYGAHVGDGSALAKKNRATGPIAAHVYEAAGTYTVCARFYDGTNTSATSGTCSSGYAAVATVVVSDPDVVFATTKTVCLTTGSDFTGCPSGATQVSSVSNLPSEIASRIGSGSKRFLLRRGDTFTTTAEIALNQTQGTLGAYGSGAKPIITTSSSPWSAIKFSGSGKSDWRVMDLSLKNTNASGGARGLDFVTRFDNVTVLRVDMTDLFRGVYHDAGEIGDLNHGLAMADGTFARTLFGGGVNSGGYPIYLHAYNFAFLGNSFSGGGYGEHVARLAELTRSVVANNDITSPAPTKPTLTLRAQPNSSSTYNVIASNKITGGSYNNGADGNGIILAVEPESSTDDERITDTIIERNWIVFTGGTTVGNQVGMSLIPYARLTVRNNVFNTSGGKAHTAMQITQYGAITAPSDIWVYNNTAYSADTDNDFQIADFGTAVVNAVAKNNLGYAPNDSQHQGIACNGSTSLAACTGLTASNNSTAADVSSSSPTFTSTSPFTPANAKPTCTGSTYPCAQGASVPVWSDFSLASQPSPRDLGAVVH